MELTMADAKEVFRFLETLGTCEYLGVPPKFDEATSADLDAIIYTIYNHILSEGGNPYA